MIEKIGDDFVFHCDECPEHYEAEGPFTSALEEAKEHDWKPYKDGGGEWCHRCPACELQRGGG